tara:strand:+ start:325 stop:441 length:117 start_codon:yes stop_codon:yes gene_type:complete
MFKSRDVLEDAEGGGESEDQKEHTAQDKDACSRLFSRM